MSQELKLISALLQGGNLQTLREAGITPEKLVGNSEARMVFEAILAYAAVPKHGGRIPSAAWVARKFKQVEFPPADEELVDLIEEIDNGYLSNLVNTALDEGAAVYDKSRSSKALVQFLATKFINMLGKCSSNDDVVMETVACEMVMGELEHIKSNAGLPGAPWPWAPMNENTMGVMPGEFYLIYGLTGSMKTWIALYLLSHLYQETDGRILIYVREMPRNDIIRRMALLMAKIPNKKFIKGLTSEDEEQRLRSILSHLKSEVASDPRKGRIVLLGGHNEFGPEDLQAAIRKWSANYVFADSAYLLADTRGKKKTRSTSVSNVQNVSGDLRELAISEHCSVITTSQEHERTGRLLGRKGSASLGYAHKLIEDAVIGFHIFHYPSKKEIGFDFPKAREYTIPSFTIHAEPAENFSFKHNGRNKADNDFGEDSKFDDLDRLGVSNTFFQAPWDMVGNDMTKRKGEVDA